ncbi:MAG: hypothetical protein AB1898_27780 [Acidobacteriota bacterium]
MDLKVIRCAACAKELNPALETVVFLTWGTGLLGRADPVLPLCPTTDRQLAGGSTSPCVAAAVKLFRNARVEPVVASYADWVESIQRNPNAQAISDLAPLLAARAKA